MTYQKLQKTGKAYGVKISKKEGRIRLEEMQYLEIGLGCATTVSTLDMANHYMSFYVKHQRFPSCKVKRDHKGVIVWQAM